MKLSEHINALDDAPRVKRVRELEARLAAAEEREKRIVAICDEFERGLMVRRRTFGRDALRDAYEEALDLVLYLRQALDEREGVDKPA